MTDEKTFKLNYNPNTIYKDKVDMDDPEIMRKLRYGMPTNIVDIEMDTPDLLFDSKNCKACGGKNTLKKIPLGEKFVRGLIGSFITKIDTQKQFSGRMLKKNVSELNFIWACEKCIHAEKKYDNFIPNKEVLNNEICERNENKTCKEAD